MVEGGVSLAAALPSTHHSRGWGLYARPMFPTFPGRQLFSLHFASSGAGRSRPMVKSGQMTPTGKAFLMRESALRGLRARRRTVMHSDRRSGLYFAVPAARAPAEGELRRPRFEQRKFHDFA